MIRIKSPENENAAVRLCSAGDEVLDGLHEASNPYWDWLWGSSAKGHEQLESWLARANSELSRNRVRYLVRGDVVAGGYIGLSGSELRICRKADTLALCQEVRRSKTVDVLDRLRQAASLFKPVAENEYFLSRIWTAAACRGQGVGRELVEAAIEEGRGCGFSKFRLDVSAGNQTAIRVYSRAGFMIQDQNQTSDGVCYCSMVCSI